MIFNKDLEQGYREFPVECVAGPRHPAYSETDDDVDHGFHDVDFRLRQSRRAFLSFSLDFPHGFWLRLLVVLHFALGTDCSLLFHFSRSSAGSSDWFLGLSSDIATVSLQLCLTTYDHQDLQVSVYEGDQRQRVVPNKLENSVCLSFTMLLRCAL